MKQSREEQLAKARAYRKAHKERANELRRIWRKKHLGAMRCQKRLDVAIKAGKAVRGPCQVCGKAENIEGHHESYLFPLAVVWLCHSCHALMHHSKIKFQAK